MFQQVSSGILHDARSVDVQLVLQQAHSWLGARNGDQALLGQFLQPGLDLNEVPRFDEAITACQDAAAIYRETGDQYREGITRENLDRALQSAPGTGERAARTLGRPLGQHMARRFYNLSDTAMRT
jgi:hypothetical protein